MVTIHEHTFLPILDDHIVVDIGANTGEFAREVLHLYPRCKVHSYEPTPGLCKCDKCNVNWILLELAVSSHSGLARLSMNQPGHEYNNSILFHSENNIQVPVQSLEKVLSFDKIDLVKLDCEGSEWDIILNSDDEVLKKPRQWSIEFHDFIDKSRVDDTLECVGKLIGLGYQLLHSAPLDWKHGTQYGDTLFARV